ncbi:MAG TPA: hypothetical protein VEK07_15830 [Polyangiaceae bacterium]|nr:hypothetical protein [Polyangiaceae bacterium]
MSRGRMSEPQTWRLWPRLRLRVPYATSAALSAFALTFTALCALPLAVRSPASSDWIVHGVVLGMSEREVRTYFVDGGHGTWSAIIGCSGPGLEWLRKDNRAAARWARFEFRNGVLVAMRVRGEHERQGPAVEATATSVRKQHENAMGSEIALIDRTCPEHRVEAELLARLAGARR